MVLHNNKWDRRAKHKYLKKHGIQASDSKKQPTGNDPDREKVSERTAQLAIDEDELAQNNSDHDSLHSSEEIEEEVFPEYEEDADQTQLIRSHFAKNKSPEHEEKPHIQTVDRSIFEQAQAGVARSKLNQNVRRIGKTSSTNIDLDSDSDFDEFMDELDEKDAFNDRANNVNNRLGSSKASVLKDRVNSDTDGQSTIESRQQFLDKLLK